MKIRKNLRFIVVFGMIVFLVGCNFMKPQENNLQNQENNLQNQENNLQNQESNLQNQESGDASGSSFQKVNKKIELENGFLEGKNLELPFFNMYSHSLDDDKVLCISIKDMENDTLENEVQILNLKTNQITSIGTWKVAEYASYVPKTNKAYVIVNSYNTAETRYLLEIDCQNNTTREIAFSQEMQELAKEKNLNGDYKNVNEVLVIDENCVFYEQNGSLYLTSLTFENSKLLFESQDNATESGVGYQAICLIGDNLLFQESYWEDCGTPALYNLKTKEIKELKESNQDTVGNIVVGFDEKNQRLYTTGSYQNENLYELDLRTNERKILSLQDYFPKEYIDYVEIRITNDFERIYLSSGRSVVILDKNGNVIENIEGSYYIRKYGKEVRLISGDEYYCYYENK